jgi:hypothetical protein
MRLGWLKVVALGWGVLFLILAGQHGFTVGSAARIHPLGQLAFVLAIFAAAAGQWLHLDLLPLGRLGGVARGLTKLSIGLCLLFVVATISGLGIVGLLALVFCLAANIGFTVLSYLLAALAAVRHGQRLASRQVGNEIVDRRKDGDDLIDACQLED